MTLTLIYSEEKYLPELKYLCKLFGSILKIKIIPCHISQATNNTGVLIGYCESDSFHKLPHACKIRISPDEIFWKEYVNDKRTKIGLKSFQGIQILNSTSSRPFLIKKDTIETNLDIFSSTFFIISVMEELTYKGTYDQHGRFNYSNAKWSKQYIDRPLINFYSGILSEWIEYAYNVKIQKSPHFAAVISHDIDAPFYFRKFKTEISELINTNQSASKYKKPSDFLKYVANLLQLYPDPFDNFDYIQKQEDARDIKSTYFIMVSKHNEWGLDLKRYSRRLEKILSKDNEIALHPGYTSYCRPESLLKEKNKLESICGVRPVGVRNHFLRMEIPTSYHSCRMIDFEYDSTMGYPDREGFRVGICTPYKPYDITRRDMIDILEIPLNIMDGTLKDYCHYQTDEALHRIKQHIDMVESFSGVIVFNWHNTFLTRNNHAWRKLFEESLDYLVDKGARFYTCRELSSAWKELWK